MINIVLYGFGNISHALVSELNSNQVNLTILSSSCSDEYTTRIMNKKTNRSGVVRIKNDPASCLGNANYIIFCVPSHIRKQAIDKIKSFITPDVILGAFPGVSGFDKEINELLPNNKSYFSAQRVPFISRILVKGELVEAEPKLKTSIAVSGENKENIIRDLEELLGHKIELLSSFELVNLTNSNPLLHTSRLFDFLNKSAPPYYVNDNIRFYEDWNDEASKILIQMDSEFQEIIKAKGLKASTILQHYGVASVSELTAKLANISSFKGIRFPIKKTKDNLNILDFSSRYFVEDFELGLRYTIEEGIKEGVSVQVMSEVLKKYEQTIQQIYLK